MEAGKVRRVIFICTENRARSQIAEAVLRSRGAGRFEAFSAGARPADAVHPMAVRVLGEIGIDIAGASPKSMLDFVDTELDMVITLCDTARAECPIFPGSPVTDHWDIRDPAEAEGSEEERLQVFREVRDELSRRIGDLISRTREDA